MFDDEDLRKLPKTANTGVGKRKSNVELFREIRGTSEPETTLETVEP